MKAATKTQAEALNKLILSDPLIQEFKKYEEALKQHPELLALEDEIKEDYAQAHGRYVEIDLRRYKTVEQAIKKFEGFHNSWISQWASLLNGKFPEITVENYYGKYGLV